MQIEDKQKEHIIEERLKKLPEFKYGEEYYKSQNTAIMARKKQVYVDGKGALDNPLAANHRLASGHFKKIVDQKVLYLLQNGIIFSDDQDSEELDDYFETSFDEMLIDAGIEASKKSESWLYAYKDEGNTKFTFIPPEQIVPIYNDMGQLVMVIRHYKVPGKSIRIEFDEEEIRRYEKDDKPNSKWKLVEQGGHFTEQPVFDGQPAGDPVQKKWTGIPFFPLYNNQDRTSDLQPIKSMIDTYDIINSDFANNIDDMQDAFYTLKGYNGDPDDLAAFMRQLKQVKAVPIDQDGELKAEQLQIPTEARSVFLKLLKSDIYEFAMAVDLKSVSGGSITNVHIKAMFADLDLKTGLFENEVRRFVTKIIDFINENEGTQYSTDFNFDRSMIVNRQEEIDGLTKLIGTLSYKTVRKLLPYEIDEDDEIENLAIEAGDITIVKSNDLPKDKPQPEGTENAGKE